MVVVAAVDDDDDYCDYDCDCGDDLIVVMLTRSYWEVVAREEARRWYRWKPYQTSLVSWTCRRVVMVTMRRDEAAIGAASGWRWQCHCGCDGEMMRMREKEHSQ